MCSGSSTSSTNASRVIDSQLDARIASFELAFRMQREAPEAFDLARESGRRRSSTALDKPATEMFGRQCLMARRLVERGVRFVQLFDAPANNAWDHHSGLREEPAQTLRGGRPADRRAADRPEGARPARRHAGPVGRRVRPHADRRGHRRPRAHPFGFTMWLAGGGVKGGMSTAPPTSSAGTPSQDKVHVHDLHATILHLMGLDHRADLPLRRPRLPPDRRPRQRRAKDPRVNMQWDD